MSILIKKFEFVADTEGWVGTAQDLTIQAWFLSGKGHHQNFPINTTLGGSLRTTAPHSNSSTENYWEWAGTWEDLGVPPGSTVTEVNLDYLYKWYAGQGRPGGSQYEHNRSLQEFLGTDTGAGPAELRDNGGTLIGTFSSRIDAIDHTLATTMWLTYPTSPDYPYSPADHTDYPITDTPPSWGVANGSHITISQASNTRIRLRLSNLLPAMDSGWGRGDQHYLRFKNDHVVVTITYSSAGGDTSGLLKMF